MIYYTYKYYIIIIIILSYSFFAFKTYYYYCCYYIPHANRTVRYNVVAARDLFITSDFHRVCSQFFCLFFLFSFPFRVIRRGRLPCTVPLHAFLYIRSINNYYTTRPLNYYRACYNVLLKKKNASLMLHAVHIKKF